MTDLLFRGPNLSDVLDGQELSLANEIDSLDEGRVLNTSPEDLCDYFVANYVVNALEIDESQIHMDYGDTKIDISHRIDYAVFDSSRPAYVTGTRFTFYVPFTGDAKLFECRPSTFSLNSPRASVQRNELVFVYDRTSQDAPNVTTEFERDRQNLRRSVKRIAHDVQQFNSALRQKGSQLIGNRRNKLLQDRGLVENLGFPLKRRSGVATTYASPEVKRRVVPRLPPMSTQPYKPEPTLAMAEYERILSVVSNMVMVMERSPQAFKNMREEDLRQHFLVQLNGQYEGQATGETFNYEGKTDILVRAEDKNVFIAECKFWSGPSGLRDALNQLLGYTSWRDTKTALLVFNRDRDMSTIIDKIPEVVMEHPNYKASCVYGSETAFRFIFANRDDPSREFTLTILAFDVPA